MLCATALNKHVICSCANDVQDTYYGSFVVSQDSALPVYHIEKVSHGLSDYRVGDDIIINSVPTCADFDGKKMFIVDLQNIIGKVCNQSV